MLEHIFCGLFDTASTQVITPLNFLLCVGAAVLAGWILTLCYTAGTKSSKSFAATLALLPIVVCVVIMMVNGNVGTGVAVAGAFSLVRFRSVPGSAKEIGAVFCAMAAGLTAGMGYLAYTLLCAVLLGGIGFIYNHFGFGTAKKDALQKSLRITIPEDLNYTDVFNHVFGEYASEYELISVKTTNMGSLFRLTYNITLKNADSEQELIDRLRCHNGNLEITVSRQEKNLEEL